MQTAPSIHLASEHHQFKQRKTKPSTVVRRGIEHAAAARTAAAQPAHPKPLDYGALRTATRRVFVAFAIFTMLATNSLLVLGDQTDRYFAWTISIRPMSGFLGAAYAAGFVLSVLSLREHRWRNVRAGLLTITVFTILTLIPTLLHLHKLHLAEGNMSARVAAWLWVAVYLAVPVACVAVVIKQDRPRERQRSGRFIPGWLQAVLAAQGATLLIVGSALFLGGATAHHLPADAMSFWPWPVAPLTGQLVGAWLIALAVAAALVIWEADLRRLFVPAVTYIAFGAFQLLIVAIFAAEVRPNYPWLWLYLTVLVSMVLTGAYGCLAATRRSEAQPAMSTPAHRGSWWRALDLDPHLGEHP
jgi:hypothetical protein